MPPAGLWATNCCTRARSRANGSQVASVNKCHRRSRDAGRAHSDLGTWLRERGLEYSADKTRLVHVTDGFDVLGFNVRLYESTPAATGTKLLIKPSDDSVRSI